MQEQKKFRHIFNGKEVDREDFEKLAGDSFKWFDKDSIVSVPFSSFDNFFNGDFKSRRQINDHLDSVLNIYQNKVAEDIINKPKCSPQCYCDGSCKKPQEKNTNSTRHKSQAGETHKELVGNSEDINIPHVIEKYIDLASILEFHNSAKKEKTEDKDDVITNSNRGEKETVEGLKESQTAYKEIKGIKESNGKVDYSEINLEILDLMAERFTANKHKYPKGNMKKTIDIKSLEWALFRHVKKMIQPIETDEETYKDHLSAVLCNASMILDQLKVK